MTVQLWLTGLALVGLVCLSLWFRVYRIYQGMDAGFDTEQSPISIALKDLAAVAGGIYVSMMAIISFLRIDFPERVRFFNVCFDPLAGISLILATVWPFLRIRR